MRRIAKVLGPILIVAGLAACGASTTQSAVMTEQVRKAQCGKGGTDCRWDNQCCSGRCYVDTGCSG
jgi:hypothetical protein